MTKLYTVHSCFQYQVLGALLVPLSLKDKCSESFLGYLFSDEFCFQCTVNKNCASAAHFFQAFLISSLYFKINLQFTTLRCGQLLFSFNFNVIDSKSGQLFEESMDQQCHLSLLVVLNLLIC